VVAGVWTLAASVSSGSLSLGGFGLNTLIDTAASGALVWRFRHPTGPVAGIVVTGLSLVFLLPLTLAALIGTLGSAGGGRTPAPPS
jgi:hypothetical protein